MADLVGFANSNLTYSNPYITILKGLTMKKYYKSLDYLLLALASSKAGQHQEAAGFFVKATQEEDVAEMVEDVNTTNQELVDGEEGAEAVEEVMAKVMAKTAKVAELRRQLAEAEAEIEGEGDEEALETTEEGEAEGTDGEGDDTEETDDEEDDEDEGEEAAILARLQRRKDRAQANLKSIK